MSFQSQASQFRNEEFHFNLNMASDSEEKSEELEQKQAGRKPYERHTHLQKRKLEEYFAMSQHPDEKDRIQIGEELGLDPLRVKFWFQNKRTQTKNKEMKNVSQQLKGEAQQLRAQIQVYKEALSSTLCPNCGGQSFGELTFRERLLSAENAQLKEENARLLRIAEKYQTEPPASCPEPNPEAGPSNFGIPGFSAGNTTETDPIGAPAGTEGASSLMGIAKAAADELQLMAESGEPLWLPAVPDNTIEFLNEEEYLFNVCRWGVPNPFGLKREATRAAATINMSASHLVEILCDSKKWSTLFSGIVLRASTMEVHSRGRNYNGALQTISAEFQLPTSFVATRESSFLRYCRKLPADETWVVVDVSLDTFRAGAASRFQRRPSGCLIHEIDENSVKVIWVENVEPSDNFVHGMFKAIVSTGIAFGANRWLSTLDRQCKRLPSIMNCNFPHCSKDESSSRIRTNVNVMKLAERMVQSFYAGVAGSIAHGWVNEPAATADDVRIASKRNVSDPSMPFGVTLNASVAFWLPATPRKIFDFLCDKNSRAKLMPEQWDALSETGTITQVAHIPTGIDHGNCILLLRVHGVHSNDNANKKMLFIQESCFDNTCSYLIYAPVSMRSMNMCMYGGDSGKAQLLPAGFTIVPDGPSWMMTGSLVTVSVQILADSNPQSDISPESVEAVKSLVMSVVDSIKNGIVDVSSQ